MALAETEGVRGYGKEASSWKPGIRVESGVTEKSMGDWRRKRLLGMKMNGGCCSKNASSRSISK